MKHYLWFQHEYVPVKADHIHAKIISPLTLDILSENVPATLILRKCKCGKLKTELIEGFHSLEDI